MFRPDLVSSALFTRVGWQQPAQGDYAILTGDNLVSLSGLYFTDYHKAVTIKNIKETFEDADISDVDFNSALERMQKAAINRVLQGVFNRDYVIEQLQLYSRDEMKETESVTNAGKFVGIRIKVAQDTSYAVRINALSLLFTEAKIFNMYCFHSVKGLIWTKSVTVVANEETVVNVTDLIVSHSEPTYKGGEFYIGYFQDDLGTCQALEYEQVQYKQAMIFSHYGVEFQGLTSVTFDSETLTETAENYGINLEMTSLRDFTQVICRNPYVFDEAVGLQMAIDCVELMINTTRSNMTERLTKDQLSQLYNDLNLATGSDQMPYTAGLKTRLTRELQRLNRNFFPPSKIEIVQC